MHRILFRNANQLVQWLKLNGKDIAKIERIEAGPNTIYPIKIEFFPMIY